MVHWPGNLSFWISSFWQVWLRTNFRSGFVASEHLYFCYYCFYFKFVMADGNVMWLAFLFILYWELKMEFLPSKYQASALPPSDPSLDSLCWQGFTVSPMLAYSFLCSPEKLWTWILPAIASQIVVLSQ